MLNYFFQNIFNFFCVCLSHKLVVDLISGKSGFSLFSLAFLSHGSPYVSDKYICTLCSLCRRRVEVFY